MNAIYRHLSDKFLLSAVLGVSLLIASSCVKTLDEQPIPLAGKWAKVDDSQMTSEYLTFISGSAESFITSKYLLVHDGTIWNCSESDFEKVSSGSYSVKSDILKISGEDWGKIVMKDDTLTIGESRKYLRIEGFSSKGQTIEMDTQVNCDYKPQRLAVPYEVAMPIKDVEVLVSVDSDWLHFSSTTDKEIYLDVEENNSGSSRSAKIMITYPGASPLGLTVYQSYSAPEITVGQESVNCDYAGGYISLNYSIENPREGEVLYASCTASWVSDIAVGADKVSFKVSRNSTFYQRTSELVLEYASLVKEINISQPGDLSSFADLSLSGTANCYIVSSAGDYKIPAVKGNGAESVGSVSSVDVLWESFGTDVTPQVGDLIPYAEYYDGCVYFSTAENFREGNAVIAARDASGNILWSWHIWLTDRPEDQVYNNGAGTMMDRNLGATSATPGDVGALGLLYQWGRKDPFLGSSAISSNTRAKSTLSWPSPVKSTASKGTIDYAVSNPVTFITYNSDNYDWYYTGSGETDDTRWQPVKTIYDPCPPGYRVPDGGEDGIWSKAFAFSSPFNDTYDSTNKGFNLGSSGEGTNKLSNSVSVCWYPSAGSLDFGDGSLDYVGIYGRYWSCSPYGYFACILYFGSSGSVRPSDGLHRADGYSVRCLKE